VFSLLAALLVADASPTVTVVPLGAVPEASVRIAERAIGRTFRVRVVRARRSALPLTAFYPPRKRFRAERLLDYLEERGYPAHTVGLTVRDVSTTLRNRTDWGVTGLARTEGPCVVSTFRLGRAGYSRFASRLGKISIHEVGHTFGLSHCTASQTCPMQDLAGRVTTLDRSRDSFCGQCREKLGEVAKPVVLAEPMSSLKEAKPSSSF